MEYTKEDKINQIEQKIEHAKTEHENLAKFIRETSNTIQSLEADRAKAIQALAVHNGAFQAFNESLRILKDEEGNV